MVDEKIIIAELVKAVKAVKEKRIKLEDIPLVYKEEIKIKVENEE